MSHVSIVTAAAAFSMSAVLMAGPKFVSTWKAPDAAGVSFSGKKVAALIMSDDLNLRMSGEEALVRELAAVGVPAGVASYRIVPKEELRDPDKAKGWYERAGVEGVVAMRLVSSDKQQTWTPSMWVTSSYSTFRAKCARPLFLAGSFAFRPATGKSACKRTRHLSRQLHHPGALSRAASLRSTQPR